MSLSLENALKDYNKAFKKNRIFSEESRMGAPGEVVTKEDLKELKGDLKQFKEEIVHEFHVISEGLMDHIKLLAERHTGVADRLGRMEKELGEMRAENERHHVETRALVKLSFSELDRRISALESQVKDLQEWRKQVEGRFRV